MNTSDQTTLICRLKAQLRTLQQAAEGVLMDIENNDVVEYDDLSAMALKTALERSKNQ